MELRLLLFFALTAALVQEPAPDEESGSEVRRLGAGSYALGVREGQRRPSDAAGRPVLPQLAPEFEGAPPTHAWFSSLVWPRDRERPFGHRMYPHPLALEAHPDGLGVTYVQTPGCDESGYAYRVDLATEALRVSVAGLNAKEVVPLSAGDWTVSVRWSDGEHSLSATAGRGLPFVYARAEGGAALVRPNLLAGTPEIWSHSDCAAGITVGESSYGVFVPAGARLVWEWGALRCEARGGALDFAVAALPEATPETLALFARHAFARVESARASWSLDPSRGVVSATFELATKAVDGEEQRPLVALYRHQWLHADDVEWTGHEFVSPRGPMRLAATARFTVELPFEGVLPVLPVDPPTREPLTKLVEAALAEPDRTPYGDAYWCGKSYGRLAQLVHIAHELGLAGARDELLSELRDELEGWLSADGPRHLAYDPVWRSIIAYPDSYGSATELNDHHFHYGYFLQAAAALARHDPKWAEAWGGAVELLIRDVANPDRGDERFPFLRHLDPYAGFSFAAGHQGFPDGNNQESSSEAVNFAAGVLLWGGAVDDEEFIELGAFLYASETTSALQYWFDVDDAVFPEGMRHPVAGIVWDSGARYRTWFSGEPEAVHGINVLPITAASLYLARRPRAVAHALEHLRSETDGGPEFWKDLYWSLQVLVEPENAARAVAAEAGYVPEKGSTRAGTWHWIEALRALGRPERQITANTPFYGVFRRGDTRTYVADNPSDRTLHVSFSDGSLLEVGPRSMARTSRQIASRETDE